MTAEEELITAGAPGLDVVGTADLNVVGTAALDVVGTAGLSVEEDVRIGTPGAGVDVVLTAPTCGAVHGGGAFAGRRVLGVCENRGGPCHAGVAYGFEKTVTVTVACWRFSSWPWGKARAPTASAEVRRVEECIVSADEELGSGGCVVVWFLLIGTCD